MQAFRILLAEDEPIIAQDIRLTLEKIGYEVIQVSAGQDATEMCDQYRPNLAILNFRQPTTPDGLVLAQALMRQFLLQVLLITGARPKDLLASEAQHLGFPILYKPFTRHQLRNCLEALKNTLDARQ